MERLFGTDGIRGVVNRRLTAQLALAAGRALGAHLRSAGGTGGPVVLVGRDTRRSGDMLQAALEAGLCAAGCRAVDLGVLPTPAVAWLAVRRRAAAAMISASHNPPEYNGIKIFGPDGLKLPDEVEQVLEEMVRAVLAGEEEGAPPADPLQVGTRQAEAEAADLYLDYLRGRLAGGLQGMRVVLDCAHGAAYRLAPALFEGAGARVTVLNDRPDGVNINRECGATHPQVLAGAVRRTGAQVGFAFDGDADRCIAVDESGGVVDGDAILAVTALDRHRRGALAGPGVVATVMSNLGLERALGAAGIALHRTRVGDRHVLEELRRRGLAVGGEQSGHVIFLDAGQTTGDGLLTAVEVLNVMLRTGRPLGELAAVVQRLPQRLENVPAPDAARLVEDPAVREAVGRARELLGDRGRILVRASGTEPVVRVMAEAEDEHLLDQVIREVAEAVAAAGSRARN